MTNAKKKNVHSNEEWQMYQHFISQLYLMEGLGYDDIARRLDEEKGFGTTGSSVKSRLFKWNMTKPSPKDDYRIIALHFRYHQAQGRHVNFKRFGKDVPQQKFLEYVDFSAEPATDIIDLPNHIQVVNATSSDTTNPDDSELHQRNLRSSVAKPIDVARQAPKSERQSDRIMKKRKHSIASQPLITNKSGTSHQHDSDETSSPLESLRDDEGHIKHNSKEVKKAIGTIQHLLRHPNPENGLSIHEIHHILKLLLSVSSDKMDTQVTKERTDLGPLHLIAQSNNKSFTEKMLAQGADINAKGGFEYTPLHIAAMNGQADIVRLFLQQEDIDVNAIDAHGATPLIYTIVGIPQTSPLAKQPPSLDCALLLVGGHADVDLGTHKGKSALHLACAEEGLDELVQTISRHTTRLNERDSEGMTALHAALQHQNEDYVNALLQAGARLDIPDNAGRTPLHLACLNASAGLLMDMIAKATDCSAKTNNDETILHILCKRDLQDVVAAIAEKPHVNIDAKSCDGQTPLIVAAHAGHFEIVRMLVQRGADLKATDQDMDTAFTIAIRNGHQQIMEFLLDKSPLEPKNESSRRWKRRLEHDKRVQQAQSDPGSKLFVGRRQSRPPIALEPDHQSMQFRPIPPSFQGSYQPQYSSNFQDLPEIVPQLSHTFNDGAGAMRSSTHPSTGVALHWPGFPIHPERLPAEHLDIAAPSRMTRAPHDPQRTGAYPPWATDGNMEDF